MTFITQNWTLILAALCLLVVGIAMGYFLRLPSKVQIKKVKEWLLFACVTAEKELGGGTGQIKLRYVYDMFINKFPLVARVISFDTFSFWVDAALVEMRTILETNIEVQELVRGEKT